MTHPPLKKFPHGSDELGPVVPRTFPPTPGWSASGHCIKARLDYSRGPEKTWVYGALRVRDALAGQSFANADEMEQATRITTAQLNRRAKSWIWGRPPKEPRHYRRLFSYRL